MTTKPAEPPVTKRGPTNALHTLRVQSGTSQKYLADLAGMSPIALHRYEQLVYAKPSMNYLKALSEVSGMTVASLAVMYSDARKDRIDRTIKLFSPYAKYDATILKEVADGVGHPYARFRNILLSLSEQPLSDMHWCYLTCFHPAQLHKFEKEGKRIPYAQKDVLVAAGFGPIIVDLNRLVREYQGG